MRQARDDAGRHLVPSYLWGTMVMNRREETVMATHTSDRAELANELLERIGQTVGKRAQASAVFGDPVEREGVTVIPVARSRFGFGGGGGSGSSPDEDREGAGAGGGGGASVSPIGYIEVRDGGARFKRILTPMDLLPLAAAVAITALTVRRLFG
jgi:uncharacterized spore protein YtfJ